MMPKFEVVIEKDEDGYFVASVPAIPGCYTQAKTKPELIRRIKDAITLCLEAGASNPPSTAKFIGIETVAVGKNAKPSPC